MGNKSTTNNVDKYRQIIQRAIKTRTLFPEKINQLKINHHQQPTVTWQPDMKLPSLQKFKSSYEIQKNILNNQQIKHSTSIYSIQHVSVSLHNNWPKSCIGLVLCEHHQNNQLYYVYGTGILIHEKVVLTSAQNVYCRRLKKQYTNIRFIVGVNSDKCSGIYHVMRIHYPKEYTMQIGYENYNFLALQLYDNLSDSCGYVGLKIMKDIKEYEKYTEYGYTSCNQQGFFYLRQRIKNKKQQYHFEDCSESGVLVQRKKNKNEYFLVGLQQSERKVIMSDKIRKTINQWTEFKQIDIDCNNIGAQGCKYLSQANWIQSSTIYLWINNIDAQGCKYLSQTNCTYLKQFNLFSNNIGAQGCKYLRQANWIHLTKIDLLDNNIGTQGCKYLSQTNWKHLKQIDLRINNICPQGCKYLSQANWKHLTSINLNWNNISAQGCKYLSQANWKHLTSIILDYNIEDRIYLFLLKQSYPNITRHI